MAGDAVSSGVSWVGIRSFYGGRVSESRPWTALWPSQLARAVGAFVVGLYITFTANHNVGFGLVSLVVVATVTALCVAWGSAALRDRVLRGVSLAMAGAGLVVAVLVLVLPPALPAAGMGILLVGLSGWAGITGALELYLGFRGRSLGAPAARDWLLVGGITAVLALLVLLIPADLQQPWRSDAADGVSGVLTADIVAAGALGAYAIVIGVVLGIAAFNSIFAASDARRAASEQPASEQLPAELNGTLS